jgi:predicted dehydrogenase
MDKQRNLSRRDFFKTSAGAGAVALGGVTWITNPRRVFGANERVRVAVVGVRGQGWAHVEQYEKLPDAEVAALCDVDENETARRLKDMEQRGWAKPKTFVDYRKLLEDKTIDAVSIATPNHWHSLQGIWACQAGKDAYIEKPCSHNWFEGRQLVRAAEKYNRIVQHGSNSRDGGAILEAIQKMREGLIGEVYMARGLCFKWRDTIGKAKPEPVPSGVHYDLWTGPAPMKPFTKNRFHYNWHWIWDTGDGDIGNQGIHQVDIARWGLGVTFPTKVTAIGGHFMFDDDQETPNTLNAAFEFAGADGKKKMMVFEVRHWISNHEAAIGTPEFGSGGIPVALGAAQQTGPKNTIGNIFYGSKGYLAMDGYDSYRTWLGQSQEPGPSLVKGGNLWANFVHCVKSRKKEDLRAPIIEGHISCTLVHLANASYRLGRTIYFDPAKEEVIGDAEAAKLLRGSYREPFVLPEKV